MKIKITPKNYDDVIAIPKEKALRPKRPNIFFRTLMKVVAIPGLKGANFKYTKIGMDELEKGEPALYLMNHSSFIDLEIVASMLYPRPFNIVATTDSFVGKTWLMRQIGCIPTKKFVLDIGLVRDMTHTVRKLKSSVVMFPEAGYSLDGTSTALPDSLGKFIKMLDVPVVMIRTYGAFSRQPLYNDLNKRNVDVSADMKFMLSREEIKSKTSEEINELLAAEFNIDHFRWQQENKIVIDEPFRASNLNRALYKCPHCLAEGKMLGKDTSLSCTACGKSYELDEYGFLAAADGDTKFDHIPDWFAWQRDCVRREIENGEYSFSSPVRICMGVDLKHIYYVGKGTLTHTAEGFHLKGAGGKLDYTQKPQASYSICADFNWYEIGDVICLGNSKALYYCFPDDAKIPVVKTRLAAEEMYKIYKDDKK